MQSVSLRNTVRFHPATIQCNAKFNEVVSDAGAFREAHLLAQPHIASPLAPMSRLVTPRVVLASSLIGNAMLTYTHGSRPIRVSRDVHLLGRGKSINKTGLTLGLDSGRQGESILDTQSHVTKMAAASIVQKYRLKHMITPRRHNVTAGRIAHYHTQINSDRTSTPSTAIADHGSAITARLSHVTAPHHIK